MKFGKSSVLIASLGFALFAVLVDWLVLGETSPLKPYFMYHVTIPNFVGRLLVLPYFALIIFRPRPPFEEIIGYGLEFIQWLVVGYVLIKVISWVLK
jgi:hypothetical protein